MIRSLHEKLVAGEVTARELTQQYLDTITAQSEVNAYISVDAEGALAAADSVDAKIASGEKIGILEGIPGGVKDLILTKGTKTTAASKMLEDYVAPYDATVVERLKNAGAIILGKTNLDEFACGGSTEHSAFGVTKNPVDPSRVAGGSSGGSAAAIAMNGAAWTLGTDTGGSIRQPASYCGIVGLKPTYGRVSRYGAIAFASSLDQIGPMTHSVEDAAIVLSAIGGHDEQDATTAPSTGRVYEEYLTGDITGAKIGIPKEYFIEGFDPAVKKVIDAAIEKYKGLGAEIKEISLPHSEYALAVYYILAPAELSSNLARFDGIRYGLSGDRAEVDNIADYYKEVRSRGFGDEIKRRIMLGTYTLSAGYYDAFYKKAGKVRSLIKQDFQKAFEEVDYIFAPVTPEPAFKIGEKSDDPLKMYLTDINTVPVNLAGVPSVAYPIGSVDVDGAKLPVGGQMIGKWFDEEGILNAAYAFEQANKK